MKDLLFDLDSQFTGYNIRTFTGLYMNVFEPTLEMICIEDIAHALSNQCRFGGHTEHFFSVAQHSLICSDLVKDEFKLAALLHDASEAYLLDVPRPIKKKLANYKEIEDNLMVLIAQKFGFKYPLEAPVKEIDEKVLRIEFKDLMLGEVEGTEILDYWNSKYAESMFLMKFQSLISLRESIEIANNAEGKHECEKFCGMNYCDDNGCVNRKRHYVDASQLPAEKQATNNNLND